MKVAWKNRFLFLSLALSSCSHTVLKLPVEEQSAIQENFKNAVLEYVSKKEGKEVTGLKLKDFSQTEDDEVNIGYEVSYRKTLAEGESANATFSAHVTLQRKEDGIWHAVQAAPEGLELEFQKGLEIHSTLSTPKPP
jgi:hypothetical protein